MGPAHLGAGFAAKTIAPTAPLWALLVAGEALDLLYLGFSTLGLENAGVTSVTLEKGLSVIVPGSTPWSHGLLMTLVWTLLAAGLAQLRYRNRWTSGVIGLTVLSHWALDVVVNPGLPLLFDGSPKVGLGLWCSGPGLILSLILDFGLLAAGVVLYLRHRRHMARG